MIPVAAKKQFVRADQVFDVQHLGEVVAGCDCLLALGFVARPEKALLFATHTHQCGGRNHTLGCAADPEQDVGARVGPGG